MSDYFDGLMRSSGLPLGNAPVLGPAPQETAPLLEINVTVPAATPLPSPVDVIAQATPPAVAAPPVPPVTVLMPQPAAARPVPSAAPASAKLEPAAHVDVVKPSPASIPPAPTPAPLATQSPDAPAITRAGVIEAAMRWVATVPSGTPAEPRPTLDIKTEPASVEMRTAELQAPAVVAAAVDPPQPPVDTPAVARPIEPLQMPRLAEPEIHPLPRSVAMPVSHAALQPDAAPQPREEVVEVSIGAIHLRVDAPAAPVLKTAPAPQPVPSTPVAKPRSSLSRRALPRI